MDDFFAVLAMIFVVIPLAILSVIVFLFCLAIPVAVLGVVIYALVVVASGGG